MHSLLVYSLCFPPPVARLDRSEVAMDALALVRARLPTRAKHRQESCAPFVQRFLGYLLTSRVGRLPRGAPVVRAEGPEGLFCFVSWHSREHILLPACVCLWRVGGIRPPQRFDGGSAAGRGSMWESGGVQR